MAPIPNSTQLRVLAEAIDGIRGVDACLIEDAGALAAVPASQVNGRKVIYEFRTEDVVAANDRARFDHINLEGGGKSRDIRDTHDALFWSEAAISKFLLPYYQRLYSPQNTDVIWEVFTRPDVAAIAHLPLSEPDFLGVYSDINEKGNPQLIPLREYLQIVALLEGRGREDRA